MIATRRFASACTSAAAGVASVLIILPFAFLELRPETTKARLKSAQSWLLGHAQRLVVAVALLLGVYLTVSALVRLS